VKEARKRIAITIIIIIITFRKSIKNSTMLQQMLKNVALLTKYSQCAGRTHYLQYGVLTQKLLASHDMQSLRAKHQYIRHDKGVRE
jgi:hypothetical protein